MFGAEAAGIIDGDEVVGGGEDVKPALGGGHRVEGRAGGIDEFGDEFGGYGFAGAGRAGEVEDGVVVEGGIFGRLEGGEEPAIRGKPRKTGTARRRW